MTDIEDRLRAVQQQISQKEAKRVREEVEVENAKKALTEAKERLREDFGISTSDDLRSVRSKLESELEAAVSSIEESLAEAEG